MGYQHQAIEKKREVVRDYIRRKEQGKPIGPMERKYKVSASSINRWYTEYRTGALTIPGLPSETTVLPVEEVQAWSPTGRKKPIVSRPLSETSQTAQTVDALAQGVQRLASDRDKYKETLVKVRDLLREAVR